MAKARIPKTRLHSGSLLSPESMGGIVAEKGFDFQTRYATCKVPVWLLETGFHQLFYEGTGDIDIRYKQGDRSSRIHIQTKDHEVAPPEFKKVIKHFRQLGEDMPDVYTCFTLVCPSLSGKLRSIETGLARLRNAQPFYNDAPNALVPTKEELDERIRKVGLEQGDIDFIHEKLFFEIGHGDLHHDDRAIDIFVGRLLNHPEYSGKIRATVEPAFAELLRAIRGKKGVVLERSDVEQILRASVAAGSPGEKSITLWVQNWTSEVFDVPADYSLDWSPHFDRSSRRVPSPEIWNTRLLPEFKSLKEKIIAERAERVIHFRGKCALSTGVVMGAMFPSVGGWTFEIPQPPAKGTWRSDCPATPEYKLEVELVDGANTGTDLVLGLNIRGDGREDVLRYIASSGPPPRLFAFMAPASPSGQSIAGSGDACAFAQAVRERLGQIIKSNDISHTRLFYYGPFALAVFLGQRLTSLGEIQVFEYQDPGYVSSVSIKT